MAGYSSNSWASCSVFFLCSNDGFLWAPVGFSKEPLPIVQDTDHFPQFDVGMKRRDCISFTFTVGHVAFFLTYLFFGSNMQRSGPPPLYKAGTCLLLSGGRCDPIWQARRPWHTAGSGPLKRR